MCEEILKAHDNSCKLNNRATVTFGGIAERYIPHSSTQRHMATIAWGAAFPAEQVPV
jgi:hypothetical protein